MKQKNLRKIYNVIYGRQPSKLASPLTGFENNGDCLFLSESNTWKYLYIEYRFRKW